MAQLLHDSYGYSYTNLQVLLGGWNAWNDNHSQNPNAYPVDATPVAAVTPELTAQGTPLSLDGNGNIVVNVGGSQATTAPTATR